MVRIRLPYRKHKLAPVYSEPLAVSKAVGNTVWLANGQRWNVRRCLRHKPTLRSSSSTTPTVSTGVSSSIVDPVADADSDTIGPVFEFSRPRVQQQQQQQPRRSQRVTRPRDLGPAILTFQHDILLELVVFLCILHFCRLRRS